MELPDVVDAEFDVVTDRLVIRWSAVFWWALYTSGFAAVAAQSDSWPEVVAMVYGAAAFPIVSRWLLALRWVAGPEVEGQSTRLTRQPAKAKPRARKGQQFQVQPKDPALGR